MLRGLRGPQLRRGLGALRNRLQNRRTESEDQLQSRLATAEEETKEQTKFDYVIVNDELEVAVDDGRAGVAADGVGGG